MQRLLDLVGGLTSPLQLVEVQCLSLTEHVLVAVDVFEGRYQCGYGLLVEVLGLLSVLGQLGLEVHDGLALLVLVGSFGLGVLLDLLGLDLVSDFLEVLVSCLAVDEVLRVL